MSSPVDFPRRVREIENVFIPLSDGARLAARIWLPEDAESDPVPAILEYLPYRKRDGTAERDALTHPWFAGHGYAAIRLDIRGSGESDGLPMDEYVSQEQDDCLEAMRWIAAQPWCTGSLGMMGISWGGFNGLQVAARRPPELKAIITLCSTDDRYADDAHFMGGCLLNDNLVWGSMFFAYQAMPPDPAIVGQRWRDMWFERLENSFLPVAGWLRHQRRDEFWRHASICEDWDAVACPVYAIGGWADGYTNAVFRLLANLRCPRKGLVGPWAHKYPHFAQPGPRIGFLQEALRWWDQWLKGRDTGIMDEPMLRAWMQESAPPARHHSHREGRWVAEPAWPAAHIREGLWHFGERSLTRRSTAGHVLATTSPQTVGHTAGNWCPYGITPDEADDQRADDGHSLLFDSAPLAERIEILGAPIATLSLAIDRPNGLVAVRFNDVAPDGAVTQLSYGMLNLAHRRSHAEPAPMVPGELVEVRVRLNDIGMAIAPGHRLRVAISTAWWPLVWPSPAPVALRLFTEGCRLTLPLRAPQAIDEALPPFEAPQTAPPIELSELASPAHRSHLRRDLATGAMELVSDDDGGAFRMDAIDLVFADRHRFTHRIRPDDPLSAEFRSEWRASLARGQWRVAVETRMRQAATADHFLVSAELDAFESERRVFSRSWSFRIRRDLV